MALPKGDTPRDEARAIRIQRALVLTLAEHHERVGACDREVVRRQLLEEVERFDGLVAAARLHSDAA